MVRVEWGSRTEQKANFAEATPKLFCGYIVPSTDFGGYDNVPCELRAYEKRKGKKNRKGIVFFSLVDLPLEHSSEE